MNERSESSQKEAMLALCRTSLRFENLQSVQHLYVKIGQVENTMNQFCCISLREPLRLS